jgi:hypothetical protein
VRRFSAGDRWAIRLALLLAIELEESCLDAKAGDAAKTRANIDAFKEVLDKHFEGARAPKIDGGEPIPLQEVLVRPIQNFKVKP